jgi:hypothetical protein
VSLSTRDIAVTLPARGSGAAAAMSADDAAAGEEQVPGVTSVQQAGRGVGACLCEPAVYTELLYCHNVLHHPGC